MFGAKQMLGLHRMRVLSAIVSTPRMPVVRPLTEFDPRFHRQGTVNAYSLASNNVPRFQVGRDVNQEIDGQGTDDIVPKSNPIEALFNLPPFVLLQSIQKCVKAVLILVRAFPVPPVMHLEFRHTLCDEFACLDEQRPLRYSQE